MTARLLKYELNHSYGSIIGEPKFVAWPVYVYRMALPIQKTESSNLNCFEIFVLKMLRAVKWTTPEAFADVTCLDVSTLSEILRKLKDKEYIDENHNVVFSKMEKIDSVEYDYKTAYIFQDAVSGVFLPYIQDGHLINDTETEEDEYFEIQCSQSQESFSAPQTEDVWRALKRMKKRYASYDLQCPISVRAESKIKIMPKPEQRHLLCPIAVPKGSLDAFRIYSPFGVGFESDLENSFNRLLVKDESAVSSWFARWNQTLKAKETNVAIKNTFAFDACKDRYPELINQLRPDVGKKFRNASKIYSSIEWALYYYAQKFDWNSALDYLDNLVFRKELERKLELILSRFNIKPIRLITSLYKERVQKLKSGIVEMGAIWAVTLLQLDLNRSNSERMLTLLQEHPDIFSRIEKLSTYRGADRHGRNEGFADDVELADDKMMREIVSTLLPDVVFENAQENASASNDAEDAIFNARISLQQDYFGISVFNKMPPALQRYLIDVERISKTLSQLSSEEDSSGFVGALYSALQNVMDSKLEDSIANEGNKELAKVNAAKAGFTSIPDTITSVKRDRVALGTTLGACVLNYLATADTEDLKIYVQNNPDMLETISEVIDLSGHGNAKLIMTQQKREELKKKVYILIKELLRND